MSSHTVSRMPACLQLGDRRLRRAVALSANGRASRGRTKRANRRSAAERRRCAVHRARGAHALMVLAGQSVGTLTWYLDHARPPRPPAARGRCANYATCGRARVYSPSGGKRLSRNALRVRPPLNAVKPTDKLTVKRHCCGPVPRWSVEPRWAWNGRRSRKYRCAGDWAVDRFLLHLAQVSLRSLKRRSTGRCTDRRSRLLWSSGLRYDLRAEGRIPGPCLQDPDSDPNGESCPVS